MPGIDESAADTTADTVIQDNEVPQAVEEAFTSVFGNGVSGSEQEQADELEQEGLVTTDGNNAAEETNVAPEETPAADTAEATDTPAEETPAEAKPANGAAALDPFLRFIGVNSGLTVEQIDKLYAADPDAAVATLNSLSSAFNNLSRQYLPQSGPPVAPATQAAEQTPTQTPTPGLDKFMSNLASFAEANGEDIGQFAKLVNDEIVTPFKAMQAQIAVQQQSLIRDEALAGFESVRKDFEDFYGKVDGQLTAGQQQARTTVANIADQIRAGAKAQGKSVTVKDAITRAHAIVTHDMQQQAARKAVVAQVQNRAKSVTSKPTQRKSKPTGERSDAAATSAAQQKMMEMGWDNFSA